MHVAAEEPSFCGVAGGDQPSKLKKLKNENKQLKEKVKRMRDLVSNDKNLMQMKAEYIECITECK